MPEQNIWGYGYNTLKKLHYTKPNIHNTHTFVTQKWTFLLKTSLKAIHYFCYNFEGKTIFQNRFTIR